MNTQVDLKIYTTIKVLSKCGNTPKSIREELSKNNIIVSLKTIYNVLNCSGKKFRAFESEESQGPKLYTRKVRTPSLIKKVERAVNKPNPPSQNILANKNKVSEPTIGRIIHEDLGLTTRKKQKVHSLQPHHKIDRKTNYRKLYENHLAGDRSEFCVTLDEALFSIQDCNETSKIYYSKENYETEEYVCAKKENFCKKFMVVGALSGRGRLPLIKIPQKTKIDAEYYAEYVLKPILEKEIPKLYGEDTNRVFVDHDAESSHTASFTAEYAEGLYRRTGITIIPKEEIPVKSPDTSPMDFFAFGFLKQKLYNKKAENLSSVWKQSKDVWSTITPKMCLNVFDSWKRRLRKVSELNGEHIEGSSKIHRRHINSI
jgi:hypothetical protein